MEAFRRATREAESKLRFKCKPGHGEAGAGAEQAIFSAPQI